MRSRHAYFARVAEARYVARKVFRFAEEAAKRAGIDPLENQALIQIYGSPNRTLRVKEVAQRLDISPAFSSTLIKALSRKGYLTSAPDKFDRRVTWVAITNSGKKLLFKIDDGVRRRVEGFAAEIPKSQRKTAKSILASLQHSLVKLPARRAVEIG